MQNSRSPSERPRARRLALALAAAVLPLAVSGCPFTPREAPEPCDPATDPTCRPPAQFVDAVVPELVRDNIERALESPTIFPNYDESLDDAFRYDPDLVTEALVPVDCPTFFVNWDKAAEVQFMQTALEPGPSATQPTRIQVTFQRFVDSGELNDPNQLRYNVDYEVVLTYTDPSQTPPTRTDRFGAVAQWDLARGADLLWVLKLWRDIAPLVPPEEGGRTLGFLRVTRGECR